MNNVNFVFYHPNLDLVSDRTLRSLLKKISTLLREIQYQEVFYLINTSEASHSEKQSMRDRLKGPLNHIDAYYIQKIEKGSITLTISLTAVGIWLLQQTIGESIKEAWLKCEMHRNLVSYLCGEARRVVVDRNIDRVLDNWKLDSFLIEGIKKDVDEFGDVNVKVTLKTPREIERRIIENSIPISIEELIEESNKAIAALNKE